MSVPRLNQRGGELHDIDCLTNVVVDYMTSVV